MTNTTQGRPAPMFTEAEAKELGDAIFFALVDYDYPRRIVEALESIDESLKTIAAARA